MSYWRDVARRVIDEALRDARILGLEGKELEKFVANRYPFGERAMHPYRIWLSEFRILVKGVTRPKAVPGREPDAPGQGLLFGEGKP